MQSPTLCFTAFSTSYSFLLTSASNKSTQNVLAVHTVMFQTCVQKTPHDDELTAGSQS